MTVVPSVPLKRVASIRVSNVDKLTIEGQEPVRLCNYTDVYYRDEIRPDQEFMEATASNDQIATFRLRTGDVLITKDSETADDIAVPAFVAEAAEDLICGYHLAMLRPDPSRVVPRFLYWAIRSDSTRDQFTNAATGVTRYGLRTSEIGGTRIALPSLRQQRAIADFLDNETASIDRTIHLRRQSIALLEEREVSLAHHTIAGRDVEGDRTGTALGWLGHLPATWRLKPVGSQFQVRLGRMLNAERATTGELRPYVRNINVRWDYVDTTDLAEMDFPAAERRQYALKTGDLLINEGGAGIGRAALWNGQVDECYFQKSVLRLRSLGESDPRWMIECMRVAVATKVFLVEGNLATIPHVPAEALRAHRFPFPERSVQVSLLEALYRRRESDRRRRRALERQVALLQEHRQALITAAVTGQIDVTRAVD